MLRTPESVGTRCSDLGQDRDPVAKLVDVHAGPCVRSEKDFNAHFDSSRFIVPVSLDGVDGDLEAERRGLYI